MFGGGFEFWNQIRHCKTVYIKRNLYLINYNNMRTKWTTKGNRDDGSSCSCDRGPHRYLAEYLYGILMALVHTSVTMLTSRYALERKKYHCGGHSWRGELFTKQLKKMCESRILVRLLRMYFPRNWNSAQLCQNFGISAGLNTPNSPLGTPLRRTVVVCDYHTKHTVTLRQQSARCVSVT